MPRCSRALILVGLMLLVASPATRAQGSKSTQTKKPAQAKKRSIPVLIKALAVPAEAAGAVGELAAYGRPAVPALIKALSDKNAKVQGHAVDALHRIGPPAAPAASALYALARKGNDTATRALTRIGAPAVAVLTRGLSEKDPKLRARMVRAISEINPAPRSALSPLTRALQDADPTVRVAGASGLSRLGPKLARSATGALIKLLSDPKPEVRRAAAKTLAPFGDSVVPQLSGLLSHQDKTVQLQAAQVLATLAASARVAGALRKALKSASAPVRSAGAGALGRQGKHGLAMVGDLILATKDKDRTVANAATQALKSLRGVATAATKKRIDAALKTKTPPKTTPKPKKPASK